jgi:hypothetical protein
LLVDLVQVIEGGNGEREMGYARVTVNSETVKWIGEHGSGASIHFLDGTDMRVTQARVEVKKMLGGDK